MAKDPAVLFYTSDFLTGTEFFTWEQKGQYIHLLCVQHQNGPIPESYICKIICSEYVDTQHPIMKKFERDENGNWFNPRMLKESQRRAKYAESRRDNIKKRYENKDESTCKSTYVGCMKPHMETETGTDNSITLKEDNTVKSEEIISMYHEILPELPRVGTVTKNGKQKIDWAGDRAAALKARIDESDPRKELQWWRGFFEYVKESDFLMGKVAPKNGEKPFRANLGWMLKKANFTKIKEAVYHK